MNNSDPLETGEVWAAGIGIFWDRFVQPVMDKATGAVKNKIEQNQEHQRWIDAAEAYRAHLIRHYGMLRVLGATQDTSLDDLFTDLYILNNLTTHRREQIEELHKADPDSFRTYSTRQERKQGITLIKSGSYEKLLDNFYILGKPGAGKTTFLKYITIQCARHRVINRIPIFVSLHEWARHEKMSLFDFIVSRFDVCKFPDADAFVEATLQEGKAILLFDGLDEVRREDNQRDLLTNQLRDFVQKYDRNQHLITCRIAASDYIFQGFKTVEVADFTPEQIETYGRKWFQDNPEIGGQFVSELKKPEHKGVYELCNTPLLLSLVCFAFDNARTFPPTRAELYEDALDVLLRKWDTSRNIQRDAVHPDEKIYRELSPKRKKDMFARIAARTFEKGEYFFRRRDLEKWLVEYLATLPNVKRIDDVDGQIVLKSIESQHSIFVERAKDIYSFSHLTFQEYFTTLYIVQNREFGTVTRLINSHLTNSKWQEVFLLTASLFDNSDNFFQQVQQAINALITNEASLVALLNWANHKALSVTQSCKMEFNASRLAYISLVLDRILAIDRDSIPASNRAIAQTLNLVRSLARMLDADLTKALSLAVDLSFALVCARDLPSPVDLDYGLYYTWIYAVLFANVQEWRKRETNIESGMSQYKDLILGVARIANKCGDEEIAMVLKQFPTLEVTASSSSWQQQANRLETILRKRNLIYESELSLEQINKLNDYLKATELLIQCLQVSVVSNRQAILDGLLAPPKAA